jgi:hypothetical protein
MDLDAALDGGPRELTTERAFADPRLPRDQYHGAATGRRRVEPVSKKRDLALSAYHARKIEHFVAV